MNKNLNLIEISEKIYLKGGDRYWPATKEDALITLNNGSVFSSMAELLEAYNYPKSTLTLYENWTFSEIFCSAFSFIYNQKEESAISWNPICSTLLFPENLKLGDSLFLFLQKNIKGDNQSAREECLSSLISYSCVSIRKKNLTNLLIILKIKEKRREKLIQDCSKVNNYKPLLSYLIYSINNLKKNEFEENENENEGK